MSKEVGFQGVIPPYNTATGLVYLLEMDHSKDAFPLSHSDLNAVAAFAVGGEIHNFYNKVAPPGFFPPFTFYASEDYTFPHNDPQAPDRWYDGRLYKAGQVDRSVVLTSVDGSAYSTSFGSIQLANGDGDLDVLPDIPTLINSRATLKIGQRGAAYSTFEALATGIVLGLDISLDMAVITLGGIEELLTVSFFDTTYLGTGDMEGTTDLEDVRKPYVFGRVLNERPILIEPLTYIFQAHAGGPTDPLTAITQVRSGGVPMTFDADYPTYAALYAAPATAIGHYSTCLAQGLIRVGLTQGGEGTLETTMDCETANVTASTLARWLAGKVKTALGVDYDTDAFDQMEVYSPGYTYGMVLKETITYADLLSDFMRSMNRYWGISRDGKLTTGVLRLPINAVDSGIAIDRADIVSVDRLGLPEGFRWPHAQRTIRYDRNNEVQTVLASVGVVNRARWGVEYSEVTVVRTPIIANALTPAKVDTNLRTKAVAQKLANFLLTLHGTQRYMYSVQFSLLSGLPGLLESISITYPRFDLDGGKRCVVVAASENYDDGSVVLTLWA